MDLSITQSDVGLTIPVKVVPGSSRTRIAGLYGSALKVNIAAAPEKGKANKQLTVFLAQLLNLPRSAVAVTAGRSHPHKQVTLTGLTPDQLRRALAPYL